MSENSLKYSNVLLFILSCIGVVMGSQVATVQMLFASLQPVLRELPKLIHAAHNYNLIVELILELLSTCARIMLIFLSQVYCKNKVVFNFTVSLTCTIF